MRKPNPDTREITLTYERDEGGESEVTLTVERQDRFAALVLDDLTELGVPADEQQSLTVRAVEAFWAAEHAAWLRTPEAEAAGF
jgi:hypothetical protein